MVSNKTPANPKNPLGAWNLPINTPLVPAVCAASPSTTSTPQAQTSAPAARKFRQTDLVDLATASLTRMARIQKYHEGSRGWDSLEELQNLLEETRIELQKEGVHQ